MFNLIGLCHSKDSCYRLYNKLYLIYINVTVMFHLTIFNVTVKIRVIVTVLSHTIGYCHDNVVHVIARLTS